MGQKCSDCSWGSKDQEFVIDFAKETVSDNLPTDFSSIQYNSLFINKAVKIQAF